MIEVLQIKPFGKSQQHGRQTPKERDDKKVEFNESVVSKPDSRFGKILLCIRVLDRGLRGGETCDGDAERRTGYIVEPHLVEKLHR